MTLPEIPITANDLMIGGLFPALAAVSVLSLATLVPGRQCWGGAIAMVAAFILAWPMVNGAAPRVPPNSAGDWLFWLAAPIGIVAAILASFRFNIALRAIVGVVVFAVTLFFMMQTARGNRTPSEWWTLWAILIAVLSIDFAAIELAVSDDTRIWSFLGLIGIAGGACILIQMSGSLKFAVQGGAIIWAMLAGVITIFMGYNRRAITAAAGLVVVGIVGALLAVSIEPLFVNVTISNALLIAAAPILLLLGRRLRNVTNNKILAAAIQLILPAIPVLIALSIAGAKALRDLSAEQYDGWE
jgi:hypothetical protein